ncbi:amidohydrolase [Pseudomonas sp. 32.2.56]|uniref:amidohydrolase family protein n=1 Tax=Pseudomonas sp. 32.2.56 TaxID=2969303 RepID=UPI00214F8887|nr:amidohydrolase [Pseudomonas sp. 32.2.56]MCR4507760.1 amidohydrolase [Pseudomonas sp. 32.2.56]
MIPVIDCSVRYFEKSKYRALQIRNKWPTHAGQSFIDCLTEEMNRNNVRSAVLVSEIDGDFYQHGELLAITEDNSEKFIAAPLINPNRKNEKNNLQRYIEYGIRAVKLSELGHHSNPLQPVKLNSITSFALWEIFSKYALTVFVRPTVYDSNLLAYLAAAFPEVNVIIESSMVSISPRQATVDEWGRPRLNLPLPTMDRYTLWGLSNFPNVSVVLASQYSFSRCDWPYVDLIDWHGLENFIALFGAERLMWGSDFPFTCINPGYQKCLQTFDGLDHDISPNDLQFVFSRTAEKLLLQKPYAVT